MQHLPQEIRSVISDVQNDPMLQRICGEFLEMPGLRLTCAQAQRLWGLDEQTCRRVLDRLVEVKFLWRAAHGAYARLTDGFAYVRTNRT